MQRGITSIIYLPDLGNTPATVNRRTGALYINARKWEAMPPEHRLFILLHEMGHVVLQSTDEKAVDAWAFDQYAKMGYSLKNGVYALSRQLSGQSPEHVERVAAQLGRAKRFDFSHYGNTKIYSNMTGPFASEPPIADQAARLVDNTIDFPTWYMIQETLGEYTPYQGKTPQTMKEIKEAIRKRRQQLGEDIRAAKRKAAEAKRAHDRNHVALRRGLVAMQKDVNAGRADLETEIQEMKRRVHNWQKAHPGRPVPAHVYFPAAYGAPEQVSDKPGQLPVPVIPRTMKPGL